MPVVFSRPVCLRPSWVLLRLFPDNSMLVRRPKVPGSSGLSVSKRRSCMVPVC